MKQLNNNFTTPEQSKRLLELGLPVDSADCYYGSYEGHPDYVTVRQTEFETEDDALFRLNDNLLPCWSVGRLIEIFAKCKMYSYEDRTTPLQLYADEINGGLVEFLIDIIYNYNDLDLSKLEE